MSAIPAPITLNPQATANRFHEYCERIALCAETRDPQGLIAMQDGMDDEVRGGFQIKNMSGRSLVMMGVPRFSPIVKS